MVYEYNGKVTEPSLNQFHNNVANSLMTNKNIEGCRWDEDTELLSVFWQDALSTDDKAILDGIVESNS